MRHPPQPSLLLLGAALFIAKCNAHNVNSGANLGDFRNEVNSGTTFKGTTVFLTSDISLSGTFSPIGYWNSESDNHDFKGVFDGQGYVISNLKVEGSGSNYAGLFGWSDGTTIRNVVLDSTCTIKSDHYNDNSFIYAGGIIAYCGNSGPCKIENCVNMASISYSLTSINSNVMLGGIAGTLAASSSASVIVKNCGNYGRIIHSGSNGDGWSAVGGIVGYIHLTSTKKIQNCLNYGSISQGSGSSIHSSTGGIIGYMKDTTNTIENCVNLGSITNNIQGCERVGGIVGLLQSGLTSKNCFWTNSLSASGEGSLSNSTSTYQISSSSFSLALSYLNNYSSQSVSWSKWLLNSGSYSVSFSFKTSKKITIQSELILLPSLTTSDNSNMFSWFKDSGSTNPLVSSSVSGSISLYGKAVPIQYTVTLNPNGGTLSGTTSVTVNYGKSYGNLPNPTKNGYSFDGWYTDWNDIVTSSTTVTIPIAHTLTAQWSIIKYKLTFAYNNGQSSTQQTLESDATIIYPRNPSKIGHTFIGWSPNPSTMPAKDTTITAQWRVNSYKISFVNDGVVVKEDTLSYDTNIVFPSDPNNKVGYTFSGWEPDVTVTGSRMPASNVVFTAQWKINSYTVTFDFNNGTKAKMTTIKYNSIVNYPNVTKEGYTFSGWGSDVTVTDNKMPASNVVFTAQWKINSYIVTFAYNNGIGNTSKIFNFNTTITYPKPSREGYTFSGWMANVEVTNKKMPASNVVFTAQWTVNNYTLVFDYGNETTFDLILNYSSTIDYPVNLSKEGYRFIGWKPKPERMPANNITVVAQWITNSSFIMSFDFGNGTVTSEIYNYSDLINYPKDFTKEGYKFIGWKPSPSTMPKNDTIVVAQWEEINSEYVEIVFGNAGLTKEEAKEIIKGYTDKEFTIKSFEEDKETGETKMIIKFGDIKDATDFVDNIRGSSDNGNNIKVSFFLSKLESAAFSLSPFIVTSILFVCL